MGTKNNPGNFDCYQNAEPDEPMFVLLGRDRHAPALVALWAGLREIDQEDAAKVDEARKCAVQMMAWGQPKGRKYVGFGQTTLMGLLELIRQANVTAKEGAMNQPTVADFLRVLLSMTEFEKPV